MDELEYKIIEEYYPTELSRKVNSYLRDGWVLYGFPYVDGKGHHLQAMMKIYKRTTS